MKGAKRVRFRFDDFVVDIYTTGAPQPEPKNPPADRVADSIIATLAEGRRKLTTSKLFAALQARGCEFSERTVRSRLAEMVADGRLTGDAGAGSEGYGLPEWAE